MLSNEEVKRHLMDCDEISFVEVSGDGYHYRLTVVSEAFEGLSRVKRQQWVYLKITEYITQGKLHACTIRTYTPSEWGRDCG